MPTAWDIRLNCLPDEAPMVTTLRVKLGWSVQETASCLVVEGRNDLGELVSETALKSYPIGCVALPEPSSLGVGLLALAAIDRFRSSRRCRSAGRRAGRRRSISERLR